MATVTAAITTHNRVDLVEAALASVLAQTRPADEVIVVDNGSTDGTREALAPYADRIRYLWQENAGRAGSRNRAIAEASGDYLAFLDSDDLWRPDKLERQVPALERRPDAAFAHGHVEIIDAAGRPLPERTAFYRRLFSESNRGEKRYADFALDSRCLTSTVLLRVPVARELGGYDGSVGLEDVDLYLRIALRHRMLFLEGPALAAHRLHEGQTGSETIARGHIEVCRKHLALLADAVPATELAAARRNLYLQLARCHHVLGDAGGVRTATLQALRLDPRVAARPCVLRQLALSFAPRGLLAQARARRGKAVATEGS